MSRHSMLFIKHVSDGRQHNIPAASRAYAIGAVQCDPHPRRRVDRGRRHPHRLAIIGDTIAYPRHPDQAAHPAVQQDVDPATARRFAAKVEVVAPQNIDCPLVRLNSLLPRPHNPALCIHTNRRDVW